ncbi:hypothetical protein KCP71_07740 [Salmonella enterica subsp. enterica]|nr:hypothetical protein KCP71_07740 [Salmonella enterica subsp. enterica]
MKGCRVFLTFAGNSMTGQRIGYIRVSTFDQNPERQLEGVKVDVALLATRHPARMSSVRNWKRC